ncbi:MAG: DUF4430 domain-containing protein [Patescibacteria group bacterium]
MKHKALYIIVGLLAAAGIFLLGALYGPSILGQPPIGFIKTPETRKGFEEFLIVNVLIDDGSVITGYKAGTIAQQQSVLEALITATSQSQLKLDYDPPEKSPYGAFVKQIGDKKNGDSGRYWQYWVGSDQPQVSADRYELKGGETILWTFRESTF